jgi:hypothetical protein
MDKTVKQSEAAKLCNTVAGLCERLSKLPEMSPEMAARAIDLKERASKTPDALKNRMDGETRLYLEYAKAYETTAAIEERRGALARANLNRVLAIFFYIWGSELQAATALAERVTRDLKKAEEAQTYTASEVADAFELTKEDVADITEHLRTKEDP